MSTATVASGHPCVTEAAAEVLRAGGNAYDAVVAAGFAAALAEPGLTGLGGGGFLTYLTAEGRSGVFDFFVDSPGRGLAASVAEPHFIPIVVRFPSSEQIFNVGLGSCAVPGGLAGYIEIHRRLGRIPLSVVTAPAAALARDGVVVNDTQAYVLTLLEPVLTLTDAGRRLFAPSGVLLTSGSLYRNPELGDFLDALDQGAADEFYRGSVAARIAADMREGAGLVTERDLDEYRVAQRAPLEAGYRGARLLTNPAPSFGGTLLTLSLEMLGGLDRPPTFGSAEGLAALAASMREVDQHRAARLAAEGPSADELDASRARIVTASGGTTHASVCDADGNLASMTTSNGECSGYVVPGTGVMLNNMMGEDDLHPDGFHTSEPGVRVASMMSPSILLLADGRRIAVGSGGSKRIRTALLQFALNTIDHGASLEEAVLSPRIHWDGEVLQVEPGFPAEAVEPLSERLALNRWDVLDIYFGGVHAAADDGQAAADPRRGGAVAKGIKARRST